MPTTARQEGLGLPPTGPGGAMGVMGLAEIPDRASDFGFGPPVLPGTYSHTDSPEASTSEGEWTPGMGTMMGGRWRPRFFCVFSFLLAKKGTPKRNGGLKGNQNETHHFKSPNPYLETALSHRGCLDMGFISTNHSLGIALKNPSRHIGMCLMLISLFHRTPREARPSLLLRRRRGIQAPLHRRRRRRDTHECRRGEQGVGFLWLPFKATLRLCL